MSTTLTIAILAVASLLGLYGLAGWLASWRARELHRLAERYDELTVDPTSRRLIGGQLDGLAVEVVTEEDPHDDDGGLIHLRVGLPGALADVLRLGPVEEAPEEGLEFEASGPVSRRRYALWRTQGELPDAEADLRREIRAILQPNTTSIGIDEGELRTTLHTSMAPVPQLREILEAMVGLIRHLE